MSVMMSDMKSLSKKPIPAAQAGRVARRTRAKNKPAEAAAPPAVFTVRDMNRNTRGVLEAAKFHGQVTVRGRSGEAFKLQPVPAVPAPPTAVPKVDFLERMRLHRLKMRELGFVGPQTEAAQERWNRIVAGEE